MMNNTPPWRGSRIAPAIRWGGYQRCRIHPRHPSAVILPRYPRYSVVILLPRHPPHTVVISAQAEIQCPYPLSLTV
jgi:hypothetical protein